MNCKVGIVTLNVSLLTPRLMIPPVVFDQFLHIAFPFSYKRMFTTKRIAVIISSLRLLSFIGGVSSLVDQEYRPSAEAGVCFKQKPGFPLVFVVFAANHVASFAIITGTSIYLRYKIIHSKRFFKSVKKSTAEQEKAMKVGRMMEILEEQVKPTVSVFIAQGIDAVFNVWNFLDLSGSSISLTVAFHITDSACLQIVSVLQSCCSVRTA